MTEVYEMKFRDGPVSHPKLIRYAEHVRAELMARLREQEINANMLATLASLDEGYIWRVLSGWTSVFNFALDKMARVLGTTAEKIDEAWYAKETAADHANGGE